MNALVPLHFQDADVRMIMRDGEPWWVLADVAAILDLSNPTKLAGRLEEYQKAALTIREGSSSQGRRVNLINEAGVYALTLNSRKTQARAFAYWLFTEVLPSIRKHGCYPPPAVQEVDVERWEDTAKTRGERFRIERLLWEQRHGREFVRWLPVFSKRIVEAIERDDGKLETVERLLTMLHAEMDVLYILTGRRTYSSRERMLVERARQHPGSALLN